MDTLIEFLKAFSYSLSLSLVLVFVHWLHEEEHIGFYTQISKWIALVCVFCAILKIIGHVEWGHIVIALTMGVLFYNK